MMMRVEMQLHLETGSIRPVVRMGMPTAPWEIRIPPKSFSAAGSPAAAVARDPRPASSAGAGRWKVPEIRKGGVMICASKIRVFLRSIEN